MSVQVSYSINKSFPIVDIKLFDNGWEKLTLKFSFATSIAKNNSTLLSYITLQRTGPRCVFTLTRHTVLGDMYCTSVHAFNFQNVLKIALINASNVVCKSKRSESTFLVENISRRACLSFSGRVDFSAVQQSRMAKGRDRRPS